MVTREILQWQRVSIVPELKPGEIHLWWQDLSSLQLEYNEFYHFLNQWEERRANRFKFSRHRQDYVLARGFAKKLLSGYLGCTPYDLEVSLGPLGKPAIANTHEMGELCFNYTDSAGYALYAFSWNCDMGVDLEKSSREIKFERIAQRRFTDGEAKAILDLPDEQQRQAFLACWTRKEGYGKALGVGIRYPLDSIDLCTDCRPALTLKDHVNGEDWNLYQLRPTADFIAALVHRQQLLEQSYFSLN